MQEGDVEDDRLAKLYKMPINRRQMKGLANKMSKKHRVDKPRVIYAPRAHPTALAGYYPVEKTMIFYEDGQNAGAFAHEFSHHLQIWVDKDSWPEMRAHQGNFKKRELGILDDPKFWDALGDVMGAEVLKKKKVDEKCETYEICDWSVLLGGKAEW
jgi:hypothetical protein